MATWAFNSNSQLKCIMTREPSDSLLHRIIQEPSSTIPATLKNNNASVDSNNSATLASAAKLHSCLYTE